MLPLSSVGDSWFSELRKRVLLFTSPNEQAFLCRQDERATWRLLDPRDSPAHGVTKREDVECDHDITCMLKCRDTAQRGEDENLHTESVDNFDSRTRSGCSWCGA